MAAVTAEVQVLTAEVRVLMVGSRQVTLSVYRQLDWMLPEEITPFGRVRDDQTLKADNRATGTLKHVISVIGTDENGNLVRSSGNSRGVRVGHDNQLTSDDLVLDWFDLPLIVLAGLK